MEKEKILSVIENLSQERDLTKEQLRELAKVFEAIERMQLELPERPITVQMETINP